MLWISGELYPTHNADVLLEFIQIHILNTFNNKLFISSEFVVFYIYDDLLVFGFEIKNLSFQLTRLIGKINA